MVKIGFKDRLSAIELGFYMMLLLNAMHCLIFIGEQSATIVLILAFVLGIKNVFLWGALFLQSLFGLFMNFDAIDNHQFLICYTNLMIFCSFSQKKHEEQAFLISESSRFLITLCMILATFWKLYSPEFLRFGAMQYFLLTDIRFAEISRILAGIDFTTIQENQKNIIKFLDNVASLEASASSVVLLQGNIEKVGNILTIYTVAIEALLAALFMIPGKSRFLQNARIGIMLIMFIPIYFAVPVIAFGKLLVILMMFMLGEKAQLGDKRVLALLLVYCILPFGYLNPLSYF